MDQDEEEIRVCNALLKQKIFPMVYKFVGWAIKRKVNRDALLHALKYCLVKRPTDPWAYCAGTLKIVNGNFNEADYLDRQKGVNFTELVSKLGRLK